MRAPPAAWLALLGLVAGCGGGGGGGEGPVPPPRGAPPPSGVASAAPSAPPPTETERLVERALERVVALRGLSARGPVRAKTVSRAELTAHVRGSLYEGVPRAAVEGNRDALVALGLAPPGFDLEASLLTLMDSELAGLYEPKDGTMLLAADLGPLEAQATLSHELVHALQDQHYDLSTLFRFVPDGGDVQTAAHALAEGDATSAMLDEMVAPLGRTALDLPEEQLERQLRAGMEQSRQRHAVPRVLERSVLAPYLDGTRFVQALRRRGGWPAVDAAWRARPRSTEQLLHVERYLVDEPPLAVPAPSPPPGSSLERTYSDVMGEQGLRLVFEEWMSPEDAAQAAQGWGGDKLGVFGHAEARALAWLLVADTEAAAQAHQGGFLRGLGEDGTARSGRAAGKAAAQSDACRPRPTGPLAVVRRGRALAVVSGPYLEQGATVSSPATCEAALGWARGLLRDLPSY